VARALDVIGEKWSLLILRDLFRKGPLRFQQLEEGLGGVAPNTLSARLKTLESQGVIATRLYENHPPRYEYYLTDKGKAAMMSSDWETLGKVIDQNFALRQRIMNIAPENQLMVDVARKVGASAHFCGSGGAICGLYRDGAHYQKLVDALSEIRCSVLRPLIFED